MFCMKANKDNTIFIGAGKGFFREGALEEGYKVFNSYVEHNLIERILREICFKLPFLPKKIWYNKAVCSFQQLF